MPKIINDEFTNAPISKQRKYQLRKLKLGLCSFCGKDPIVDGLEYCEAHRNKRALAWIAKSGEENAD